MAALVLLARSAVAGRVARRTARLGLPAAAVAAPGRLGVRRGGRHRRTARADAQGRRLRLLDDRRAVTRLAVDRRSGVLKVLRTAAAAQALGAHADPVGL